MLWYENDKVERNFGNISSFQDIFTISGGVAQLGQKMWISVFKWLGLKTQKYKQIGNQV
jgi:hypothetical protein